MLRHGRSGWWRIACSAIAGRRSKDSNLRRLLDCAKFELQQRSHRIEVLPIVIIYLNNVCDSRCVTCSIWKNNERLTIPADRQMSSRLLNELYETLGNWRPRQILLSGGE